MQRKLKSQQVVAILLMCSLVLSACNFDSSQLAGTAASADAATAAFAALQAESEGPLDVEVYAPTGAARWIEAEGGGTLTRQFARQNLSADAVAMAFVTNYGAIFGLSDAANALQLTDTQVDETGEQHVKFSQHQNGIIVFGTDIVVHLDAEGAVRVANGYTLPNADTINTTPNVAAEAAAQAAIAHAAIPDGVAAESYLEIFNLGLITDAVTPTYLVYRIRVDSPTQPELAQWVFVDAHTGEIRYSYEAVTEGRNRNTYNLQTGTSGGVLARNEAAAAVTTAPNCTAADVNNAHDFAGNTYDFFFSRFGRDSYNNAGAALNSRVCYSRNYQNAFWDGSMMTYGAGFPVDDVVAHELSHAVTAYSSRLIYSGQSGGLNESFSDIMGEAIDLTNGRGNDAANVRWDMGEEIPSIGAIRDMMDPERFGSSMRGIAGSWVCSADVHYSSAVQNKAFALMVDGGTYNGYTISPVGIDNAVKIVYRANTQYMTQSSKFLDAYRAMNTSCNALFGATSATCVNVKNALQATNMHGALCGAAGETVPTPTPSGPIPTPGPITPLNNGGFESGRNNGWTETDNFNYSLVVSNGATAARTGSWKAWLGDANNNTAQIAQNFTVPAGGGSLRYYYKITSSDSCGYDYGYVQVNDTVLKTYNLCTTNVTSGYVLGTVSLSAYAGQTVSIRFRLKTDSSILSALYIDDVAFGAGSLVEEIDPHASLGETAPEVKPTDVQEDVDVREEVQAPEEQLEKLFLPLINQ